MKNIVILGGGIAGWLTSLYLHKCFPLNNITVIENSKIPTIIAGESSGATLTRLFRLLDIDLNDFIQKTNATAKLGSIFYDWKELNSNFVHGLIDGWYDTDFLSEFRGLTNHYDFFKMCMATEKKPEDFLFNCKLIRTNKLPINKDNKQLNTMMYHIDSRGTAKYLKELALSKKNLKLIDGDYISCKRKSNGDIEKLLLKDNIEIPGDMFIDCSGFARLLSVKELNLNFKNYSNLFPAQNVMAWWDDNSEKINHTRITAMKFGWSWNINLQHRTGNGYLYDPNYINYDEAIEEASKRFNTKITPVANLKFTPSLCTEPWKNNVICLGLSAGFLEPLEANGLAQVVLQLELMERYLNFNENPSYQREIFNKKFNELNEEVIDFLLLHYKSGRSDTGFWKTHKDDDTTYTKSLKEKIERWNKGIFIETERDCYMYNYESLCQVLMGLDIINKPKLKEYMLLKNKAMMEGFENYYKILNDTIIHLDNQCIDVKQWKNWP